MSKQIKRFDQIAMDTRKKEHKFLALRRNLLALNALFEAARAGEVGTEFFVAVDDVRNIAMQGTKATSDKNDGE